MMRRMRTSKAGIELIKRFEGFRARAVKLPNGAWTIGYAHTKSARENLRITPADAIAVLREYDLPPVEKTICDEVLAPLNQNEFDALVSFVFNIGSGAFLGSNVLAFLNSGERLAAIDAMSNWRKAYLNGRLIIVDALVRRRTAEQALFLKDPAGAPVAPSGFVRPVEDKQCGTVSNKAVKSSDAPTIIGVSPVAQSPQPALETGTERQPSEPQKTETTAERAQSTRLTRTLGPEADDADRSTGPTPDEITRAISALANPESVLFDDDDDEALPEDLGGPEHETLSGLSDPKESDPEPAEEELPPLPLVNGDADTDHDLPETTAQIDDLEPAEIDPLLLQQALVEADLDARADRANGSAGLLRSLIGLFGLFLAAFGIMRMAQIANFDFGLQPDFDQYLNVGSVVIGGVLFVMAVYLGFRASRQ